MTVKLLPDDFDKLVSAAVRLFWRSRRDGTDAQEGSRGKVVSGKNMDGFLHVVRAVVEHCGLPDTAVFAQGKGDLTLPGYYRVTKMWDVLIVFENQLLAAFEFKSQVGSFGNNINNRTEEALGSAIDFQMAAQHERFHPKNHKHFNSTSPLSAFSEDPKAPFLGYLMLLQDSKESTSPKTSDSMHFHIDPEFKGTSYAERYKVLCERMVKERLYDAAALMLSAEPTDDESSPSWRSLSAATQVRRLFAEFAGRIAASYSIHSSPSS